MAEQGKDTLFGDRKVPEEWGDCIPKGRLEKSFSGNHTEQKRNPMQQ